MSATQNRITELVHEAAHCNQAYRLWQIATELNRLGAWEESRGVERKAEHIEDEAANEVAG